MACASGAWAVAAALGPACGRGDMLPHLAVSVARTVVGAAPEGAVGTAPLGGAVAGHVCTDAMLGAVAWARSLGTVRAAVARVARALAGDAIALT